MRQLLLSFHEFNVRNHVLIRGADLYRARVSVIARMWTCCDSLHNLHCIDAGLKSRDLALRQLRMYPVMPLAIRGRALKGLR